MNQLNATRLLDKTLAIDKVLYEQQLGLDYIPPIKELLTLTDLPSYQNAISVLKKRKI